MMTDNSNKISTWNVKKCQRFQAKKRKLEALLNLFEKDITPVSKKKKSTTETLSDSYKHLKDELKRYVKKPEEDPLFYLTRSGLKALVDFNRIETHAEKVRPLFIKNVYELLLKSTIGHMSTYPLNWATLERPQYVTKTVIVIVEGVSVSNIFEHHQEFKNLHDFFPHIVQLVSSNVPFAVELINMHKDTDFHIQSKETYSTLFPKEKDIRIDVSEKKSSKLHLLLSPIQMAMENYPLPKSVFQSSKSEDYVFTKDSYRHVKAGSPMFAIDCEMCQTSVNPSELTRVAIIDENLDVVYHSLVKPINPIVNYMTKFSGITEEMLADVTTKLSDVQKDIQNLLPPDAIICGQSLNCDLHALQMIHPYVIDTSIIFNSRGIRGKKDSLKYLTKLHLNEVIQDNKRHGHDPIEDAVATMKLVQLKLQNDVRFGDACLEVCTSPNEDTIESNVHQMNSSDCNQPASVASNHSSGAKIKKKDNDSFFAKLVEFKKKACLIGNEQALDLYGNPKLGDGLQKMDKSNNRKVTKATLKQIQHFDFIAAHLNFALSSTADNLNELNDIVGKLNSGMPQKAMFMLLVSGVDEKHFEDIKNGLLFISLKKS